MLPNRYITTNPINASFDWIDFISGCGYKTFYGFYNVTLAGVGVTLLASRTFDTRTGYTYLLRAGGADFDQDFDITFQHLATIGGGNSRVNFSLYKQATASLTITGYLYHVRGGVETELGHSYTFSRSGGGAIDYYRECLNIAVTSKSFAIGDILRLSLIITNSAAGDFRVYVDPSSKLTLIDTDARTIGTDLTIDVPFIVNI